MPRGNPKLLGQKSQTLSLSQNLAMCQTFLAPQLFASLSILYWNYNGFWHAFANFVALMQ